MLSSSTLKYLNSHSLGPVQKHLFIICHYSSVLQLIDSMTTRLLFFPVFPRIDGWMVFLSQQLERGIKMTARTSSTSLFLIGSLDKIFVRSTPYFIPVLFCEKSLVIPGLERIFNEEGELFRGQGKRLLWIETPLISREIANFVRACASSPTHQAVVLPKWKRQ